MNFRTNLKHWFVETPWRLGIFVLTRILNILLMRWSALWKKQGNSENNWAASRERTSAKPTAPFAAATPSPLKTRRKEIQALDGKDAGSRAAMVLRGHEDSVIAVGFSPDNHWLATGSADRTVRLWDLRAQRSSCQPSGAAWPYNAMNAVGFSPNNHWLATARVPPGGADLGPKVPGPAARLVVLRGLRRDTGWGFSPDSHWLATGSGTAQRGSGT